MTITEEGNTDASSWRSVVRENDPRTTGTVVTAPREVEQQRLHATLRSTKSAVVIGDAGVGKTQLITRTVEQLHKSIPSIVICSIYVDETDTSLLDLIGAPTDLPRTNAAIIQTHLLEWVAQKTDTNAAAILRIEDAHLLDEASTQTLATLIQADTLTCVISMRSAAARHKPWSTLLHNGCAVRLELKPFSRRETEAFLQNELGGPVTADSAWRVWRHTGGNPYHVAELVRDQISHRAFFEIEGVWMWDGNPQPDPQLHEIISDDMERFSPEARSLVETLAFLGPMPTHLLYDLATDQEIAALDRRGLLTVQTQQQADGTREQVTGLMHDLYASAVRTRVSRRRRTEILAYISGEISTIESYPALRSRFVELAVESDFAIEPQLVIMTTRSLLAEYKPRTVIRLASRADSLMPTTENLIKLLTLRAEAWRQVDSPENAKRDLDQVCELIDSMPDSAWPAAAAMVLSHARVEAAVHQYHYDQPEAAIAYLHQRRDWLAGRLDAAEAKPWLDAIDVSILTHSGYAGKHDEVNAASIALLVQGSHPERLVPLACPAVLGLADQGDVLGAVELSRRYVGVAYAHLDQYQWGPAEILAAHSLILYWAGDIEPLVTPHPTVSTDSDPALVDRVSDHLGRALIAVVQGAWSTAATEFHAANARFAHTDMTGMGAYALYGEALAAAASGASANAWALLERADATPRRTMKVVNSELDMLRIDTLCWLRDKSAITAAQTLAQRANEQGLARAELEALHRFVVRSVAAVPGYGPQDTLPQPIADAMARLHELSSVVTGKRPGLLVEHAKAMAAGDTDLASIRERDLARCGLWLAPVNEPVNLTRREREIAALAAGGMSSKAIAQRLVVSVRTVDSHLSRVFAKTGVHSREELARVLR